MLQHPSSFPVRRQEIHRLQEGIGFDEVIHSACSVFSVLQTILATLLAIMSAQGLRAYRASNNLYVAVALKPQSLRFVCHCADHRQASTFRRLALNVRGYHVFNIVVLASFGRGLWSADRQQTKPRLAESAPAACMAVLIESLCYLSKGDC